MPDGAAREWPADVILMSAEDGIADTIRPRLEASGADLDRVHVFEAADDRPPILPEDWPALTGLIQETDAALVVIDPVMPFLDGRIDSHRDQDVRRALHALSATAERTGAAILIVRHLNKSGGSNPLYRGGGSIGIIGAARAGMLVAADPSDGARRILAMTKSNLAPQAPALAFRIVSDELRGVAVVKWEGPTSHKATDLLFDARHDDEKGALGETMAFLRDDLKDGPMPARDV